MARSIQLTQVYDFPVEQLWHALTDAEALSKWLMPCNFIPEVGHEFQFRTTPSPGFDGVVNCRVLELVENEKLVFTWQAGSLDTIVTFELLPQGERTVLNFEQSGFSGFINSFVIRRILSSGWKKKILTVLLPQYLAK